MTGLIPLAGPRLSRRFGAALTGLAATVALSLPLALSPSAASALTPPPMGDAEMVFESGGRIMSMKADGSERTILTRRDAPFDDLSDDADSAPRVSPDGQSIVFFRYLSDGIRGSVSQIVIKNRGDGAERVLLSNGTGRGDTWAGYPVWSADSKRVFFIRFEFRSKRIVSEVRSIRGDGTGDRRISRSTMTFRKGKPTGARLLPFEIAASPDGGELLVTYSRVYGAKPSKLVLLDLATAKRRLVQKDAASGSFSPDGRRIVFVSERNRRKKSCYEGHCSFDAQLYLMKASGRGVKRLIPGPVKGYQSSPDWSADGRRIAFTSRADEIFSAQPDGRCLTRLTNGSPGSGSPDWAPEPGRSSDAGTCGDAARKPVAEITPEPHILNLKLAPFWLGRAYGDRMLSSILKDGRAVMESYDDCSRLRSSRCLPPVSITSGPVCEKYSNSVFDDGTFRKLIRRRGALVMLARPSGGGLETIAYSGGVETGIYTPRRFHGRKATQADHLKIVDTLRPVTREQPVATFEPAVFTLSEVRKARAVFRTRRRVGSLTATAKKLDMFPGLAAAYLRFGKDLEPQGKVLTVKCRRRSAVPGSIKPR